MNVELESRLPEIVAKLPRVAVGVTRDAATRIANQARLRAPVESGDLKRSIHIEGRPDGYATVAWSRDAFYGHMVEFGTGHSPPQPFLIPAFEAERTPTLMAMKRELGSL